MITTWTDLLKHFLKTVFLQKNCDKNTRGSIWFLNVHYVLMLIQQSLLENWSVVTTNKQYVKHIPQHNNLSPTSVPFKRIQTGGLMKPSIEPQMPCSIRLSSASSESPNSPPTQTNRPTETQPFNLHFCSDGGGPATSLGWHIHLNLNIKMWSTKILVYFSA